MNKSNILAQAAAQAQISASEPNLDAALASVTTSVINTPQVAPQVPPPPSQPIQQQIPTSVSQTTPQPAPVQHATQNRTTAVVMNQSQLHQQHQNNVRQNNVHVPVGPNERTEPVIPNYSRIISNQNFNSNVQTDKQHNQKQKDERTVSVL